MPKILGADSKVLFVRFVVPKPSLDVKLCENAILVETFLMLITHCHLQHEAVGLRDYFILIDS